MATHSSILAWRIPWTEEPGGLQSIGLQRVRHDWSDLALEHWREVKTSKYRHCHRICPAQDCLATVARPNINLKVNASFLLNPKCPSVFWDSIKYIVTFSSVQSLSRVQLFVTPWTAALQTSLSITNSQSLLKLMSIESVMPSKHLICCCPLLLLPSVFPCIKVFSTESVLHIRWPEY